MLKPIQLILLLFLSLSIFAMDNHSQKTTYQLIFKATWSTQTHPKNFPSSAHFSSLIGTTHQKNYQLWQLGGIASDGVKQTAEDGNNSKIRAAIKYGIQKRIAKYIIQTRGISSPDQDKLTFQVDKSYPLLSLISMLAPSADWIVGVDSYPLYDSKTGWIDQVNIDLLVYDAGTKKDNPVFSYYPNKENKRQPIVLATHQDSDFRAGKPVIGQFILRRLY